MIYEKQRKYLDEMKEREGVITVRLPSNEQSIHLRYTKYSSSGSCLYVDLKLANLPIYAERYMRRNQEQTRRILKLD